MLHYLLIIALYIPIYAGVIYFLFYINRELKHHDKESKPRHPSHKKEEYKVDINVTVDGLPSLSSLQVFLSEPQSIFSSFSKTLGINGCKENSEVPEIAKGGGSQCIISQTKAPVKDMEELKGDGTEVGPIRQV